MADFKNISPNEAEPFYFNADDICTIIRWETDNGPEMSFYSRAEGSLLRKKDDGHYLNGKAAVETMLGDETIEFPLIRDGQKYATAYFSPDAFDYIISSSPYDGDNKERLTNVLIGLDGVGRLDSYGISEKRLGEVIRSLKQTDIKLNTILPTQGTARFYNPGIVALNPEKVDRIKADGANQVWVYFNETDGIDFQLPNNDRFITDQANKLLQQDPSQSAKKAFSLARTEGKKRQIRKTENLIRAITRKTEHLVSVEGHDHAFLVRPDMIRSLQIHNQRHDKEPSLTLTYNHESHGWPESDHLVFDNDQKAIKALTALRQAANRSKNGPSAQQRRPDAPRPPVH